MYGAVRKSFVFRFNVWMVLSALVLTLVNIPLASAAPQFISYEAESAALSGGAQVTDKVNLGLKYPCFHPEYTSCMYWYDYDASGGKYVSGLNSTGAKVTFTVQSSYAGDYKLSIKYTTPSQQASTLSIRAEDAATNPVTAERKVNFPAVYDDPSTLEKTPFTLKNEVVSLAQGTNTITLERAADDAGEVYLDNLTLIPLQADFNEVVNPGFETGNIDGWTESHPAGQAAAYGVDGTDTHSGNQKLYFWSETPYSETISQGLVWNGGAAKYVENGLYEVSAWVKLQSFTGEQPAAARMEVANSNAALGDPSNQSIPIPLSSEWTQIKTRINVDPHTVRVYFHLEAPGSTSLQIDDVSIKTILVNAGFEYGDIQGWTEWHPDGQAAKYGVDYGNYLTNSSPYGDGGKYKLYFWNDTPYQQSVHQKVTGLENGRYRIRSHVKLVSYDWRNDQTRPYKTFARIEFADYGGEQLNVNIPEAVNLSDYQDIWTYVDVTTGELDLGFYLNAQDTNTSLSIDSIWLYKVN